MHAKKKLAKALDTVAEALAELVLQKLNGNRSSGLRSRRLDMRCRVTGCRNRSRGPRFGYICDAHRAKLTKPQQQTARDQYHAKDA